MSLDSSPKADSTDSYLRKIVIPIPTSSQLSPLSKPKNDLPAEQGFFSEDNRKQDVFHLIDDHQDALFLFADMEGFTKRAQSISTKELMTLLNKIYTGFINIINKHPTITVVKIAADCIMLSSSSVSMMSSAEQARLMMTVAVSMSQFIKDLNKERNDPVHFRFGMHMGPAAKIRCSIPFNVSEDWVGMGVIVASLMESSGQPDRIQVSKAVSQLLGEPSHRENHTFFVHKGCSSPRDFLTPVRISSSAPTIGASSSLSQSIERQKSVSLPNAIEEQFTRLMINSDNPTEEVTVFDLVAEHEKAIFLFADMQLFAKRVERTSTPELISLLNFIYNNFINIIKTDPSIEVVKVQPDCIMLSASVSSFRSESEHAKAMLKMALKLSQFLMDSNKERNDPISFRFGLHIGAAAKVICRLPYQKPKTDWLGKGPILASRMETSSLPNQVQMTTEFYHLVKDGFECAPCTHEVKSFDKLPTYFVTRELPRENEDLDQGLTQSTTYTPSHDSIILERRKSLSAPVVQYSPNGTPKTSRRHMSGNNASNNTSSPKG